MTINKLVKKLIEDLIHLNFLHFSNTINLRNMVYTHLSSRLILASSITEDDLKDIEFSHLILIVQGKYLNVCSILDL